MPNAEFSLLNGSMWYLTVRHDGKAVHLFETRHEAVGRLALYHDANGYRIQTIVPQPIGDVSPAYKPTKDYLGYLEKHELSGRGCCG